MCTASSESLGESWASGHKVRFSCCEFFLFFPSLFGKIESSLSTLLLFKNLSVGRNIEVAEGHARDRSDARLIDDAIDRFGLRPVLGQSPDALSYGHMRRLEIIRALSLRPKLLMLDEPAAGLSPAGAVSTAGAVASLPVP